MTLAVGRRAPAPVEHQPDRRAVAPAREGGRSVPDRRPAPCPTRPRWRRGWRAAGGRTPRAASPVIQRLSPAVVAIRPSSEVASFSATNGRPFGDARQEAGVEVSRLRRRARPSPPRCRPRAASRSRGRRRAGRDPRWRQRSARCRRRSAPRRRAASCRDGSRVRASHRPCRRARASPAIFSASVSACGRPPRLGAAAADDVAVRIDDHAADGGIGPGLSQIARRQRQGGAHVLEIGASTGQSSSLPSLPMKVSKSLASRKLR